MRYDGEFCVFILTHGRPDNVRTAKMLEKVGYTGPWYIVIDNEDATEGQYREKYGDRVLQFDKPAIARRFDTGDNFDERRTVVYARNACFDLAEKLGCTYFLELDDDYTSIRYRYTQGNRLWGAYVKDFDAVVERVLDYYISSGALTLAFAQGGDFIGGKDSNNYKKGLLRKAMNTFFCSTKRRFDFVGRINEDVNTYTSLGSRGELILTITDLMITQEQTQKSSGGMTDVYLDSGTYLKSFYSVMYAPSCVDIRKMGETHKRLHHNVNWRYCVPQIISESRKKSAAERWWENGAGKD